MTIVEKLRKYLERIDIVFLFLIDVGVIYFATACAHIVFQKSVYVAGGCYTHTHLLFPMITLPFFYLFDLYYTFKDFRRYRQVINLILAVFFSAVLLAILAFYSSGAFLGVPTLVVYSGIIFVLTLADRAAFSMLRNKVLYKNAVLVGSSAISNVIAGMLSGKRKGGEDLGINIVGYVADTVEERRKHLAGIPHLGKLADIDKVLDAHQASLIIYGLDETGDSKFNEMIIREKLKGRDLIAAISLYEAILGQVPYEYIPSAWLMEECLRANKFTEVRVKRLIDIVLGTVFFVISLPIMIVCAAMISFESKGSPLYFQKRVGRFGKMFTIYKLRTMFSGEVTGAHKHKWGHLYQANKGRVTGLGRFFRKYHIDELPQFFNVIKGDMSLVGPRPEMELFIKRCETRIPFYRLRLAVRPGVTGWAQIWHAHSSTLAGYKTKFKYDLYYLSNLAVRLDLEILLRTVFRLFGYLNKKK